MRTRAIENCELCGKARLAAALTDRLCPRCRRACESFGMDVPITEAGLDRLLDAIKRLPPETP
jgi:hypothetical protein